MNRENLIIGFCFSLIIFIMTYALYKAFSADVDHIEFTIKDTGFGGFVDYKIEEPKND